MFLEALLCHQQGFYAEAEAALKALLSAQPGPRLVSGDLGMAGYKARHLLGQVLWCQKRSSEAEAQWQLVVAERPRFAPAWEDLGELYLSQGRWTELDTALGKLQPLAPEPANLLRAQGHLARREFFQARAILEGVIARMPKAVKPRLLLGRVLLAEGRDRQAAEQTLRAVLAIDPQNVEAQSSVAILAQQRRSPNDSQHATGGTTEDRVRQEQAIEAVRKIGGTVIVDETRPDRPVIEINLHETQAGDANLIALRPFKKLRALHLGLTQVGDGGLEHLQEMTDLRLLGLNGTRITDVGLRHISGFRSLQVLALGGTRVTDSGLEELHRLPDLCGLFLNNTGVTDNGLKHLQRCYCLEHLDLQATKVAGPGLVHIRVLGSLRHLDLSDTQVGDADLEHVEALERLEILSLRNTLATGAGLERLARFSHLQTLDLSGTKITDASLEHLAALEALRRLNLGRTTIGDPGLEKLKGMRLESLGLAGTKITDRSMGSLATMLELKTLDLGGTQVHDSALAGIKGLGLLAIGLRKTPITDFGLASLNEFSALQALDLSETQIGDGGLCHLADLPELRQLGLRGTCVSDAGLSSLSKLRHLEVLDLRQTGISDAGLVHLSTMQQLRALAVGKTKVTAQGIETLQKALPALAIRRETLGEILWTMAEKLLTVTRLLPLPSIGELTRSVAEDQEIVNRSINEHTADRLLHLAAARGSLEHCKLLLDNGAEVDARGDGGRSPLHHAAVNGSLPVAQELLRRGATLAVTDERGETAFGGAARGGHPEIAKFLEECGDKVDLNTAICLGRLEQVRELLAASPRAYHDARSPHELLPDAIRHLIRRANPGDDSAEARRQAIAAGRPIIEMLLDQGADPNCPGALEQAVQLPDTAVARLLLDRGAKPDRGTLWANILLAFLTHGDEMRKLLEEHKREKQAEPVAT